MNAQEHIAVGVACWIRTRLSSGLSFACEGLPELSIEQFFRSLSADPEFVAQAGEFSFALAGFGIGPTGIADVARAAGLQDIGACSDDLHEAAHWRNNRAQYPRTIALARGYNAGVHTLGHYLRPESGELAQILLMETARTLQDRFPGSPPVHRGLLEALAKGEGTEPLRSAESVAAFLACWDGLRPVHGNEAPVLALPELGLLEDRELFAADHLDARLALNLQHAQRAQQLRESELRKVSKRRFRNPGTQARFDAAVAAVEAWLRATATGRKLGLDLENFRLVVKPPKDEDPTQPQPDTEPEPDPPPEPSTDLVKHATEALLDGDEETLAAIADALEAAWDELDSEDKDVEVSATLSDNRVIETTIRIDAKVVDWVSQFCTESTFGGCFRTQETDLEQALANAAEHQPVLVRPDEILSVEGETHGLGKIFADWDQDMAEAINANTALAETWRAFRSLREALLPHLPKLIWHAREWLDGRPQVLADVRQYLTLAARLYRETEAHYQVMASISKDWARAALEALLCLDIVQVRMVRPDGKERAAAVLLPTHPLHLWRTERLSTLLRGLAQSSPIDGEERETVRKELERPEQFLSVLRLPTMPEGRGLNQLLPYTNRIPALAGPGGLAVFENLHNACSGADGVKALGNALDQFAIQYPNRPYPLRVAVVNPPAGGGLAVELARLLNEPRYRGGQRLSAIDLDLYATAQHSDRLRDSLRFGRTQEEDKVQEKVAAGRLLLRVQDDPGPATLEDVAEQLKACPHHLVALFDESSIRLRRRTAGKVLPMSPFCVRYDVHLDQRSGHIELQPQPGESPFSEFLDLINAIEDHQRDAVVQTYADAAGLAETVDALLQGERPAATWLMLADRALPQEAGMRSVRIWERREGLRDTFLAARDFNHLARLLAPVFHRVNVSPDTGVMASLLHQGARLLGDGLLALINKRDGKLDTTKAIGLVGLLFVARELQRRYPGALVLSVDHPLAQLWLRIGKRGAETRCDLLVLWCDPGDSTLELIAVEVKTSDAGELKDATMRKQKGREQICHTLEAIADGLAGAGTAPRSPLSVPRCEMLKQTLARAATGRSHDPSRDRENRLRWGAWLRELFHEREKEPRLRGCLVTMLLRRASGATEEDLPTCGGRPMRHLVLGQREIGALLSEPAAAPGSSPVTGAEQPADTDTAPPAPPAPTLPATAPARASWGPAATTVGTADSPATDHPVVDTPSPEHGATAEDAAPWPPTVNALGLIGQDEAVQRLIEQVVFAQATGQRFPDKLLVGPAGVGKSTIARRIGKLLGHETLFFSGPDVRRPADLIARLAQAKRLDDAPADKPVVVQPVLLFIDEVHGIAGPVATSLLSAMDDSRMTSIDGRLYDFNQAIFLLATTDPGRLSEAFQSRPNKTWLRPYSLHELAGILWLHGMDCLDGAELARDACYEIAARNQCNPRRSVRQLSQTLVPHFFSRAMAEREGHPSLPETAAWLTRERIAAFYDEQGIDPNGLDDVSLRFLRYLKQHGAASEPTLRQALGLAHQRDFVETAEYLLRLGLIETSSAGRRLTRAGHSYLRAPVPPDLRGSISRSG
jgi:Holliday junction resolvasome RuvABC ATP-dependent DNA helicase subunit